MAIRFAHASRKRNDFGRNTCGSKTVCINACASGESVPSITSTISAAIRRVTCTSCAPVSERRQCLHQSTHPQSSAPVYERKPRAPAVSFQQATTDVETGSAADFSGIEQGVVRGATADVDIQYPTQPLFRKGLRPAP